MCANRSIRITLINRKRDGSRFLNDLSIGPLMKQMYIGHVKDVTKYATGDKEHVLRNGDGVDPRHQDMSNHQKPVCNCFTQELFLRYRFLLGRWAEKALLPPPPPITNNSGKLFSDSRSIGKNMFFCVVVWVVNRIVCVLCPTTYGGASRYCG